MISFIIRRCFSVFDPEVLGFTVQHHKFGTALLAVGYKACWALAQKHLGIT